MRHRYLLIGILLALFAPSWAQQVVTQWSPSQKHPDISKFLLQNKGLLDSVPQKLGVALKFPRALPIVYADYGDINAVYSPAEHKVLMGYEMCDYAFKVFKKAGYSASEATKLAVDAYTFVLLHELGHAVIGELDLPVTGREEDCADEFATWVCANLLGQDGARVARGGALMFLFMGQGNRVQHFPWWDEHSFDGQRANRIAADINAHYPNTIPEITKKIPTERLAEAVRLKTEKRSHWLRQLAPHLTFDTTGYPRLKPAVSKAREGHLRARLGSSQNPTWAGLLKKWETSRAHEKMLSIYDDIFLWPRDVDVLFTDTGKAQCSYSKDQARITISIDAFGEMAKQLKEAGVPAQEFETHLANLVGYSVLYEISRAFIGEMEIPYTGSPEDAANELTTLMIVSVPKGREIGLTMVDWLNYQSRTRTQFIWSDQSLDIQHMYDMMGYLYAAAPERYAGVIKMIPNKNRLLRYRIDYQNKEKRWTRLLEPYAEK